VRGNRSQLLQVFPALLTLLGAVAQPGGIARLLRDAFEERCDGQPILNVQPRLQHPVKRGQRSLCCGPKRMLRRFAVCAQINALQNRTARIARHQRKPTGHRDAQLAAPRCQCRHGLIADAARWHVDHAHEADIIRGVVDEPQVGKRILDLFALVEPRTAHQPVGDAARHKRIFQRTGLRIRAVHDRTVAQARFT